MRGHPHGRGGHRRYRPYGGRGRGRGQHYHHGSQHFNPRPRAPLPPRTITCPHPECKLAVQHLDKHIQRMHTRKIWGFQCPCGYSTSCVDGHLFKSHRAREHAAHINEDITPFKVIVPEGYMSMEHCPYCSFMGFNQEHVEQHVASAHLNGSLPTFQMIPTPGSVAAPVGSSVPTSQARVPSPLASVSSVASSAAATEPPAKSFSNLKIHKD